MLGVRTLENVDVFHGVSSQRQDSSLWMRHKGACRGPPSPCGLWRGSLRSLRYEGLTGLAQPKLAKRAKAGGARRDRTADLLHAMQALSQLSYGPLTVRRAVGDAPGKTQNHSSGIISCLFVTADITNDVGHVLIALFVVGDEGRIIVIVVLEGLVDFDVVLRFGHDGLDLAGVLLGIGLLE